jgi:hypothetical protein
MSFNYKKSVSLFHLLIVVPILAYIGYYKENSGANAYTALLVLATLMVSYHLYRIYVKLGTDQSKLINIMHTGMALLFLYIGYYQTEVVDVNYYYALLVLAASAFAIHAGIFYDSFIKN